MDMKKLKVGDQVAYKNVGYGFVSYEEGGEITRIQNDRVFTETFEREGLIWYEDLNTWGTEDNGLGLNVYLVDPKDPAVMEGIQQ